jgi:hypothetical protein
MSSKIFSKTWKNKNTRRKNSGINDMYYDPRSNDEILESLRKASNKVVKKIIAPLNSEKKIDKVVETHAHRFIKRDQDFEGDTLEEYKVYMKESLTLYVILTLDINMADKYDMSFEESRDFLDNIKDKYRNIFLRLIYDRV